MQRDSIKILVVDEDDGVRQAFGFYFESLASISEVFHAGTGEMGLEIAQEAKPDVVLMDICMPQMNGVQVARRIHKACPSIRIIGWAASDEPSAIRDMLAAGAHAFIMKRDSLEETTKAIFMCFEESCYLSCAARRLLLREPCPQINLQTSRLASLSARELQVVELRAGGMFARQIADALEISEHTVRSHLGSAMSKLGVRSTVDVVRIYMESVLS